MDDTTQQLLESLKTSLNETRTKLVDLYKGKSIEAYGKQFIIADVYLRISVIDKIEINFVPEGEHFMLYWDEVKFVDLVKEPE